MLTTAEVERLKDAYGSVFYRRLMMARLELEAALDELDNAIRCYDAALQEVPADA